MLIQKIKMNFMKKTLYMGLLSSALVLSSCNESKNDKTADVETKEAVEEKQFAGVDADVTVGDIKFTTSINRAAQSVIVEDGKVHFKSERGTDYFSPPDGSTASHSAPILMTKVDNTEPFTFTAKVTPEFTEAGTYTAGVVYVYGNDALYQKLCFEQDERAKHRIVTVRTVKTSDDNNHDLVTQPYVYMKISSDGKSIGSYYSLDNKSWQMVRLYKNNYSSEVYLGISSQSPKQASNTVVFEDLQIEKNSIKDFRLGL